MNFLIGFFVATAVGLTGIEDGSFIVPALVLLAGLSRTKRTTLELRDRMVQSSVTPATNCPLQNRLQSLSRKPASSIPVSANTSTPRAAAAVVADFEESPIGGES
jgi:hypothetical protein